MEVLQVSMIKDGRRQKPCYRCLVEKACSEVSMNISLTTAKVPQEVHGIKAHCRICPSRTNPHHRKDCCKENKEKYQKRARTEYSAEFQPFSHAVIFIFFVSSF